MRSLIHSRLQIPQKAISSNELGFRLQLQKNISKCTRDISAWTASRISKPRSVFTSRKTNLRRRKIMVHKILILEDDQPILDLMDMMIRRLSYEPVLITNGLEALDLIKQEPPDLILLDIMMVPING